MCPIKYLILLSFIVLIYNITSANSADISDINSAQQQKQFAILQGSSILFGLTTVSNEKVIGSECHQQLQQIQRGILQKMPWAMKMYDASGNPTSGFMYGNLYWLGDRETCDTLNHPVQLKISKYIPHRMNQKILTDISPFHAEYRVVYLHHNSSWQMDAQYLFYDPMVHIGLCLPSICNLHEIEWLMSQYLMDESFVQRDIYDMQLQVAYAKDFKLRMEVFNRPSFYLTSGFLLFTFVMSWVASLLRASRETETKKAAIVNGNGVATPKNTQLNEASSFARFVSCYDLKANWPKCFGDAELSRAQSFMPALSGVQFACALGVTLFHVITCCYFAIANKLTLYQYGNNTGNLNIFVDVFFLMSGILHGYFFHSTQQMDVIRHNNLWRNSKLFGRICLLRLLRITPMLWFIIGIGDFSSSIIEDISSFHWPYRMYEKCEQYWWRNLFFIQNLFSHNDLCAFWTWSVACDMQFFMLSTLLLIIYVKHPRAATITVGAIFFANISYTFLMGIKINFQISLESSFVHLTTIYMNPLSRIMAYGCGVITGWCVVAQRERLMASKRLLDQFGYMAAFVFLACIFVPVSHEHSVVYSLALLLLQRLLFSLSACVALVANAYGRLPSLSRIFESPIMLKFSKTSYALSLLNPMIIGGLAGMNYTGIHVNLWTLVVAYFGIVVTLIVLGLLMTLLFDIPYRNMTSLLLKKKLKAT